MSLDLLNQYIDHALTFERLADAESNRAVKADLERQASAYRRLAATRARKLGLPAPSKSERRCENAAAIRRSRIFSRVGRAGG